jgi:hypothetical protein
MTTSYDSDSDSSSDSDNNEYHEYKVNTTHIIDWFLENQWWVEDLSTDDKIKLCHLFYIYQVYDEHETKTVIPQTEDVRDGLATLLGSYLIPEIYISSFIDRTLFASNDPGFNLKIINPFFCDKKTIESLLNIIPLSNNIKVKVQSKLFDIYADKMRPKRAKEVEEEIKTISRDNIVKTRIGETEATILKTREANEKAKQIEALLAANRERIAQLEQIQIGAAKKLQRGFRQRQTKKLAAKETVKEAAKTVPVPVEAEVVAEVAPAAELAPPAEVAELEAERLIEEQESEEQESEARKAAIKIAIEATEGERERLKQEMDVTSAEQIEARNQTLKAIGNATEEERTRRMDLLKSNNEVEERKESIQKAIDATEAERTRRMDLLKSDNELEERKESIQKAIDATDAERERLKQEMDVTSAEQIEARNQTLKAIGNATEAERTRRMDLLKSNNEVEERKESIQKAIDATEAERESLIKERDAISAEQIEAREEATRIVDEAAKNEMMRRVNEIEEIKTANKTAQVESRTKAKKLTEIGRQERIALTLPPLRETEVAKKLADTEQQRRIKVKAFVSEKAAQDQKDARQMAKRMVRKEQKSRVARLEKPTRDTKTATTMANDEQQRRIEVKAFVSEEAIREQAKALLYAKTLAETEQQRRIEDKARLPQIKEATALPVEVPPAIEALAPPIIEALAPPQVVVANIDAPPPIAAIGGPEPMTAAEPGQPAQMEQPPMADTTLLLGVIGAAFLQKKSSDKKYKEADVNINSMYLQLDDALFQVCEETPEFKEYITKAWYLVTRMWGFNKKWYNKLPAQVKFKFSNYEYPTPPKKPSKEVIETYVPDLNRVLVDDVIRLSIYIAFNLPDSKGNYNRYINDTIINDVQTLLNENPVLFKDLKMLSQLAKNHSDDNLNRFNDYIVIDKRLQELIDIEMKDELKTNDDKLNMIYLFCEAFKAKYPETDLNEFLIYKGVSTFDLINREKTKFKNDLEKEERPGSFTKRFFKYYNGSILHY